MPRYSRALLALSLTLGALGCADGGAPALDAGATDAGATDADAGEGDAGEAQEVPDAGPLPPGAVTAVSLNLRCLIDDWDLRKPIIARELAGYAPDLVGVQEACAGDGRDNVAELAEALAAATGRTYAIHRRNTHTAWDTYAEGVATLSALPVEAEDDVALPTGAFPRAMIMLRVTTPSGPLVFATTHLDHQSPTIRRDQAEAAVAALDDFGASDHPTLVTGDFNAAPTGAVTPVFTRANYLDVWDTLHPDDRGRTFPARNPTERIDYLWLRGASPAAIGRILVEDVDGVYGSDHVGLFGVVTE